MNKLNFPSRRPKPVSANWVNGTRKSSTWLVTTTHREILAAPPKGKVLLIHRIIGQGVLRAANAYDVVSLQITNDGGSTGEIMPFLLPTTATQQGRFSIDWKLGGRLVVPEGYSVMSFITSDSNTVRLTIEGEYMGVDEARQLGMFTNAAGNFVRGRYDIDTVNVDEELIAGVDGQCIQLLGMDVRGFANDGATAQTVTLSFSDGTNFFPITKFWHKGTNVYEALAQNTGLMDITGPAGYGVYIAMSKDTAFSVNVVGRFVNEDQANTWDTSGRHNDHGTATGGDTNTLTDTARTGIKAWITDELIGATVRIIAGTNAGQSAVVESNTDNDLEFAASSFSSSIDNTSVYRIEKPTRQHGDKWWMHVNATQAPFARDHDGFAVVEGMVFSGAAIQGTNLAAWAAALVTTPATPTYILGPGLVTQLTFRQPDNFEGGTASAGGATTLTDATKSWTVNQWAGFQVRVTAGTGTGNIATIASNTATALTVASWNIANPDNTSVYQIWEPAFGPNTLFADDLYLPWFTKAAAGTGNLNVLAEVYVGGFTSNFGGLVWGRREPPNRHKYLAPVSSFPLNAPYQGF